MTVCSRTCGRATAMRRSAMSLNSTIGIGVATVIVMGFTAWITFHQVAAVPLAQGFLPGPVGSQTTPIPPR